jgi:hypothetical protein
MTALESGETLDTVLARVPADQSDLREDLRLAAQIRQLPHPNPDAAFLQSSLKSLEGAMMNTNQRKTAPAPPKRTGLFPTFAISAVLILAIFSIGVLGAWFLLRGFNANTAVVKTLNGSLEVSSANQPEGWHVLEQGGRIHSGDQIRTGSQSTAIIQFSDGSQAIFGPQSLIVFDTLEDRSGEIAVTMTQKQGRSSHRVVPFQNHASSYIVDTPAGTASVKGTEFSVDVLENGASRFIVNRGEVQVSGSSQDVSVSAGQVTDVDPGEDPDNPTYQFSLQGSIGAKNDTNWMIAGVTVEVSAETNILGTPGIGDQVYVTGRILEDNLWMADQIVPVAGEAISNITGTVQKIGSPYWLISGVKFMVTEDTLISGDVELNSPVKVIFTILDTGDWQALSITSLEEKDIEPEPTATTELTPDPDADPSLSFMPDELTAKTCASSAKVTGKLVNTSDDDGDYAAGVVLGYSIEGNAELVNQVRILPDRWDRIDPGEAVTFKVGAELSPAWNDAAPGTEIKIKVFVAEEINRPDHLPGQLTVTFIKSCAETPTPTGTKVTETPIVTPDLTPSPTTDMTTTPEDETTCTGANPHPTGTTLALRYGVPYEEIMYWFCQHFGFGEIDLAYSLSQQSGVPVEEIFAMKSSGMGWGNIKKALEPTPPKEKKPKPTKKK